VQRDARLLWIADEALLDEYDEEHVAGYGLGTGTGARVRAWAHVQVAVGG